MDIEEYQSKDIAGKILYLASLFKGIKDHLDVLNEREEFNQVQSQIFTILNDLELGIHELCILYEILEKEQTKKKGRGNMKTWKLVAGILSIVLSVFVFFQSVLVGTANTMSANGEVGGSAGVFVSIFMLAGGIVSIAVRNSQKNGGNIAVVILFLLASFLGIGLAGSFSDLNVWAGWCLINAVLAIISIFKQNKGVQQ